MAAHVKLLNSGLSVAFPNMTFHTYQMLCIKQNKNIASPIKRYTDPIELEMALLISVMIISLAFGKTIIGITAKSNTMTTPMKVVQSITFPFSNVIPLILIYESLL